MFVTLYSIIAAIFIIDKAYSQNFPAQLPLPFTSWIPDPSISVDIVLNWNFPGVMALLYAANSDSSTAYFIQSAMGQLTNFSVTNVSYPSAQLSKTVLYLVRSKDFTVIGYRRPDLIPLPAQRYASVTNCSISLQSAVGNVGWTCSLPVLLYKRAADGASNMSVIDNRVGPLYDPEVVQQKAKYYLIRRSDLAILAVAPIATVYSTVKTATQTIYTPLNRCTPTAVTVFV
jgi:hypothetical protein